MSISDTAPLGGASDLYRAIWRWHFFAGLIAIPFMLLLAVTGAIYLLNTEINDTVFGYRNNVPARAFERMTPETIVAAAVAAVPESKAKAYREPVSKTSSAMVTVAANEADTFVFVDPYAGAILDTVAKDNEFFQVTKKIHSLDYFGWFANRLIEAAAGFVMVLVATGIYLWWPRQRKGGVFAVRMRTGPRTFWRDLHAVTGAYVGLVVFFLAISGMPWSGFWGASLNSFATRAGIGYPETLWDSVPKSDVHAEHALNQPGWTVEQSPMPQSKPSDSAKPIGLDKAVETAKGLGIAPGFETTLPDGAEGVYTAAIFPDAIAQQRMIHIDQYSAKPLIDLGVDRYGKAAQWIEWGISIHQGQEYGRVNQLLMLTGCLAIILMSVAAIVMWWKRRPLGRLGVPPYPSDRRVYVALWIAAALVGIAFPITGLAIIVMLAFDLLLVKTIPPLRRAFA
jgi:uncharacterized iron-regulated membrane protein